MESEVLTLRDLGGWSARQVQRLRSYWYIALPIVAVTSAVLVYGLTTYEPTFIADKQFVSVKANSNIFSGLGLSALGLGGVGSDPLSSGKGIVTVSLSERILVEVLETASGPGAATLTDRLLATGAEGGPLYKVYLASDTLPRRQTVVTLAAALPKADLARAAFDIDTEFVTLEVETSEPGISEDFLTAWYAVLTEFYREQLYGQKAKDVEVLQGKADSLRGRIASLERSSEEFQDRYQDLVRRSSQLPLKRLARDKIEASTVYKTVLENLEVLRLNVETAGPVFAELNIPEVYARRVKRPTLLYLAVYVVATALLLGAALYLLPSPRP